MKTRIRLLAVLMVLLTVFGTLYIPSVTAATAEATLTVTPEGGTVATYSGTYQDMHAKIASLAPKATVNTEYKLVLNSDAAYTKFVGFNNVTDMVSIIIDLNGYDLDVTNVSNNIYFFVGSAKFLLDGADDEGNPGTIINRGIAGGIIYTQNKTENEGFVGVVQNVNMYYTNMAQGFNTTTGKYPNQPMCHLNKGDVTLRNVHLTYTGEDATAVVGSAGSATGDITALTPPMITVNGTAKLLVEDCSFVDVNTKGIKTIGINGAGSAKVTVRNSSFYAYKAVSFAGASLEAYGCEFTGTNAVVAGAGKAYFYGCDLISENGASIGSNANTVLCDYADRTTTVRTDKLSGTYTVQSGYKLEDKGDGLYEVVPTGSVEATLAEKVEGGAHTFYSGTYQDMHIKLAERIKVASTVNTYYTLMLHKDASYTKHVDLVSASTATLNVHIDLNGYDLLAKGMHNNLYTIIGTTTGYYNFSIDGADKDGNISKITCPDFAGGLIFTRANNGLNANTVATVTDLEMFYTNMSAGIGNNNYANQPMMNLPAGQLVTVKNVKMTYTGEDASALEGKDVADVTMPFIAAGGVQKLVIEDCEFIDTNTRNIKTYGLSVSGGTKAFVKNSKIKGYYGINCGGTNSYVQVIDSEITGTYCVYNVNQPVVVIDTVSNIGAGGRLSASNAGLHFVYGNGENVINSSGAAITGTYAVQTGYTLVKGTDGAYTMSHDTSVQATIATVAVGAVPTYKTGSFDTVYQSINSAQPSVETAFYVSLNKDGTFATAKNHTVNSNVSINIDLNGHKLTATHGGNLFQIVGNYRLDIDGADKDGNVGLIYATGHSGAIVYPQNNGKNDDTVITIHDIEMYYTNLSQGYSNTGKYPNQPMSNIPAGTVTFDRVKVTYTGEDAYAVAGSTAGSDITKMYTAFINVGGRSRVTVNDSEFIDTNTKGITTRAILVSGEATVEVNNSEFIADNGAEASGKAEIILNGCELTADKIAFNGNGSYKVSDTTVNAPATFIAANTCPTFYYGTGKTILNTTDTTTLSGTYELEEGCSVQIMKSGSFRVVNEKAVASGLCGDNANWKLTEEGALIITGSGNMTGYSAGTMPWAEYKDRITSVTIGEGITSVGNCALYGFNNVKSVTLPESLKSIGEYAFYECSALTEAAIPANVYRIGKYAFRRSGITTVTMPTEGWSSKGVALDAEALADTSTAAAMLTKSEAQGYGYYLEQWVRAVEGEAEIIAEGEAGNNLFWALDSKGTLTVYGEGRMKAYNSKTTPWKAYSDMIINAVIEEGVTSVSKCAFYYCSSLATVSLPSTLTKISEYAFFGCSGLKTVTVPASVNAIGDFAFRKCAGLNELIFENTTGWSVNGTLLYEYELAPANAALYASKGYYKYDWTYNADDAEASKSEDVKVGGLAGSLKWHITNEGELVISGNGAMPDYTSNGAPWYNYSSEVTKITVSEGVTAIGKCAFYDFKSVEALSLPSTLNGIGAYAFYGNRAITSVTIPAEVGVIGEYAFRKTGLTSAAFESDSDWFYGDFAIVIDSAASLLKNNYQNSWVKKDRKDVDIKDITVDGVTVSGFDPSVSEYTVDIDVNGNYKTVSAVTKSPVAAVDVEQATFANGGIATITVTSADGSAQKQYKVKFNLVGELVFSNSDVVNKDGADAAVSFVIDDGNKPTGTIVRNLLNKYDYLTATFALITKDLGTLSTTADGTEYVMDGDKYVYTQTQTQLDTVQFWQDILSGGRCEIISHTVTHSFWGINDEGGVFDYVKSDGKTVVTSGYIPNGSSTKELYASQQMIKEMFPSSLYPEQKYLGFITPGISVATSNVTIDGTLYPTYNTYFRQLLQGCIEDGFYTSARGTFQVYNTSDSYSKVATPAHFSTMNGRLNVPAFMIVTENRNSGGHYTDGGIDNWTAYIDHAIKQNGLATFCIHNIADTITSHNGHLISTADADALFGYAAERNVWVGTYSDVTSYYIEWASAKVSSSYNDGKVSVSITDSEDDAVFNYALTVKVSVPTVWESAVCGGETLNVHRNDDGSAYVYVNVVPDTGAVEIIGR